jgi:hypothetical protein
VHVNPQVGWHLSAEVRSSKTGARPKARIVFKDSVITRVQEWPKRREISSVT